MRKVKRNTHNGSNRTLSTDWIVAAKSTVKKVKTFQFCKFWK